MSSGLYIAHLSIYWTDGVQQKYPSKRWSGQRKESVFPEALRMSSVFVVKKKVFSADGLTLIISYTADKLSATRLYVKNLVRKMRAAGSPLRGEYYPVAHVQSVVEVVGGPAPVVKNRRACVEQTSKKYVTRPGPPFPANQCAGQTKVGNDGKSWKSIPNVNDVFQWKPVGGKVGSKRSNAAKSVRRR